MAQVKISALTAADPLTGSEEFPLVQGGVTKRATTSDLESVKSWPALVSPSSSSGSLDIDLSSPAGFSVALDEDVTTLTFSNAPSSRFVEFTVAWTQDGTGGWDVTFPSEVQDPPTIDTAANAVTITRFATWDGGANIYTVDDGSTYYAVSG